VWFRNTSASRIVLAVSAVYVFCLLSVGLVGAYTISTQNKATENALRVSQTRANEASKTQTAFLTMGKAQAQLVSASDAEQRRTAAVPAISALSALDENIQQLQQALPGSPKVLELTRLLAQIAPAKMEVIKAVRAMILRPPGQRCAPWSTPCKAWKNSAVTWCGNSKTTSSPQ
jgi:phosphoglycerate-specific signal transduction histidine kinase